MNSRLRRLSKSNKPRPRITAIDFGSGFGQRVFSWKLKPRRNRVLLGLERERTLMSGRSELKLKRTHLFSGLQEIPSATVLKQLHANSVKVITSNVTLFSDETLLLPSKYRPILAQIFRVLVPNGRFYLTLQEQNIALAKSELEKAGFTIEPARALEPKDIRTFGEVLVQSALNTTKKRMYRLTAIKRMPKKKKTRKT